MLRFLLISDFMLFVNSRLLTGNEIYQYPQLYRKSLTSMFRQKAVKSYVMSRTVRVVFK